MALVVAVVGDGGVVGDAGVLPACAVLKSECRGANRALGQVWGRCWSLSAVVSLPEPTLRKGEGVL